MNCAALRYKGRNVNRVGIWGRLECLNAYAALAVYTDGLFGSVMIWISSLYHLADDDGGWYGVVGDSERPPAPAGQEDAPLFGRRI